MSFMSGRIVKSGLEKRTCQEDEAFAYSLSILHAHCEGCYNRYCVVSPDGLSSCKMVECSHSCGQRLHECKLEEHKQICSQEKVPCINQAYGCPLRLLRSKINVHLSVCPASVIRCVIEWNRWPMHSQEENIKAPLPLNNPHVKCAQLDVALALRDQRMLLESMKAPKRIRSVLQNPITQRYPSVPFEKRSSSFDSDSPSGTTSVTVSDDETDAPWESTRLAPGLKMSVYSKLCSATKNTSDSLSTALNLVAKHMQSKQEHLGDIREAEEVEEEKGKQNCSDDGKLATKLESLVLVNCQSDTLSDGVFCEQDKSNCDIPEINGARCLLDSKNSSKCALDQGTDSTNRSSESGCECNLKSVESNQSPKGYCQSDIAKKQIPVPDGQFEEIYRKDIKLHQLLGVSLNIECISKYIAKHPKMYTFLCAQDFRRKEYMWHFKNVHNDIHCGLNGVVEQRCPLAYLGCSFSHQRLVPGVPKGRIVHSALLESFGMVLSDEEDASEEGNPLSTLPCGPKQPTSYTNSDAEKKPSDNFPIRHMREATPEIVTSHKFDSRIQVFPRFRNKSGCDSMSSLVSQKYSQEWCPLLCLPVEVLLHLVTYLDSFSLNNLSLTCKLLRNISSSVLTDKGMVTPVWDRVKTESKVSWQISHKKWFFSTSFSPVYRWHYSNTSSLSEHLKVCPFNRAEDKVIRLEKWTYDTENHTQ